MSNRRMFSKKIINSAKFLKMPLSSQALYFHLGLNADDDGVVEAFTVLRLVGGSEDDFRILISKQFIIPLNEEQVCFVVDWLEHNMIRADRKVDSIYKQLLMQCIDNVKLIESKPRADRLLIGVNGTSQSQSRDGLRQDKTRQVKTRQDKLNSNATAEFDFCDFDDEEIIAIKDWLQYKKENKNPYTPTGLKSLRTRLLKFKLSGILLQTIEHSIANQYAGLFEPPISQQLGTLKKSNSHVINKEDYSDEAFKKVFGNTPKEINNRFMERYTKQLAEQNKENK
jgi:hypothetical protein